MPTDHLQTASAEHRNTDCGLKMSAVSFDRANDGLIAPVNLRRVMTRAQRQSRPSIDGQSQQLRPPNNAMKLSDVSLGSRWTREEIARLQDGDAVLREVRGRLSAGGVADSAADGHGRGTTLTDRRSNNAPKQGRVAHVDKLKLWRRAAAVTGVPVREALSVMRRLCK
jgi:hypothetical protein